MRYAQGDKSRAICPHCAKLVSTTFGYRDVPFDDGKGKAKHILVAVCDLCSEVAAVPAQSTPAIRHARETADIPLEVSLLAPEIEILDAAAHEIDPQATTRFRKAIITYYLAELSRDAEERETVKRVLTDWIALSARLRQSSLMTKVPNQRLSFKISPRTEKTLAFVLRETGWNKTNLVRGVVMMAQKDILEKKSRKRIRDLQVIAAAVNA